MSISSGACRKDHPLRAIRTIDDVALSALSGAFAAMYAPLGRYRSRRKSCCRALLLQAFYTVRSERQLMERPEFDLLFRWFVGLSIDDQVWDHSCVLRRTGSGFWRRRLLPVPHVHSRSRARSRKLLSDEALLGRWRHWWRPGRA